jgi:hypothetical protein
VQPRRTGESSFLRIHDRVQGLVLDVDQIERRLGSCGRRRGDRGDRIADEADTG